MFILCVRGGGEGGEGALLSTYNLNSENAIMQSRQDQRTEYVCTGLIYN